MKFDFKSALMGACLMMGLLGLYSFMAPRYDCLTQEQEDILAVFSLTPGYIDDCNSGNYPTLRVTGVNLQIVNGLGSTNQIDGTGNLIVGYLNNHCGGGSHNVIIGDEHVVSSYASLVVGHSNTTTASRSVVFGLDNNVYLDGSCVLGGTNNTVEGDTSVIVGGDSNFIDDDVSAGVITGGQLNEITAGNHGVVSGGYTRSISGTDDWQAGSLFEDN